MGIFVKVSSAMVLAGAVAAFSAGTSNAETLADALTKTYRTSGLIEQNRAVTVPDEEKADG